MADRIELNFGANTSEVERGTDRIADGLSDTERKLEDVGQAGEDAGQKAADGLGDVGTSAGDVGGKLGQLGEIASDVMEGDIAGGARSAVGALSSFASLVPGIGTAIGAGLALAANAFIGSWEKAAKANEERVKGMYDDMIKSGNDFASTEFVNSSIHDIIEDEGRLAQVRQDAADAGVRVGVALRAEAGDQLALATVLSSIRSRRDELNAAQDAYIAKNGQVSAAIDEQIGGLDVLEETMQGYGTTAETAAGKADLYRTATVNAGTATGKLGQEISKLPGAVAIDVQVNTAAAEAALKRLTTRARNIEIGVVYRNGKPVLQ